MESNIGYFTDQYSLFYFPLSTIMTGENKKDS